MKRAAAGESTIYQDSSGRWHGYVSMGLKDNGRRDRRHVSAAKRGEVVAKVRALEATRNAGLTAPAGRSMTVAEWLEYWLVHICPERIRPATYASYETFIYGRLIPALGHHRLDKLRPEHLETFYRRLRAEGLAGSSIRQHHRVLSRALKVAVQRERVGRNVATLVDAPRVAYVEIEPLSQDEARRLLAACRGERNAARWTIALSLGLRQGEALGLRWSDVDLDAGILRVRQALQSQKYRHGCAPACDRPARTCPQRTGGLVFVPPKSRAGRRYVALPGPLVDGLVAHRAVQNSERLATGPAWQDYDLVFATAFGTPIHPAADGKAWKRLLEQARVRDARLHDARHTAATLLLQHGVPARVVMEVLGHSQISLTQNTYQHVVPEIARAAADRMTDALWG